ncbi:FkbM family methyltransferase [uncultured Succiniclasticum sp.]|uniref:FkbM family methyltransferase n=1 Tax=uncultured Succiniclasticum sp. TaxID=1500547 RepID=UPI0025E70103|nr:FkbM family methyltransferase [uncultured Succiniclasticum sp.]
MLPFINEENTLWEYLKTAGKPVVLYGTGDGADKVLARLAETGVPVSGIFASDEFVRGQQFHGFTVQTYSELLTLREEIIVLIAFASELPDVLERFYKLASVHETYAPHVPVFSGEETVTPAWIKKHETKLLAVYERLADAVSRETFASVLNYKLSGKLSYLQACTTNRPEDLRTIFSFGREETYLDLGAYNGDTVQEFLQLTHGRYKKIIALEPDPKNYKKLTDYVRQYELKNVTCLQAGVWNDCGSLELNGKGGRQSTFWEADRSGFATQNLSQTCSMKKKVKKQQVNVVSVDAVLGNDHADYMKFDVEGVEKEALEGAAGHLAPDGNGALPKLLVAAYHHDEDLFALPLLLWKLQPEYQIYLRKHPYVPAWEINIFAK